MIFESWPFKITCHTVHSTILIISCLFLTSFDVSLNWHFSKQLVNFRYTNNPFMFHLHILLHFIVWNARLPFLANTKHYTMQNCDKKNVMNLIWQIVAIIIIVCMQGFNESNLTSQNCPNPNSLKEQCVVY